MVIYAWVSLEPGQEMLKKNGNLKNLIYYKFFYQFNL